MNDPALNNPALLPAGLRDVLPPEAESEAALVEGLMSVFGSHGYERVKPPLLEFEDTLLAGSGAAVAEQTFRLMDPDSQRMMGLRADTTPQVARIATTRLANAPRPLRLSYAGQCLHVRGSQLDPDRQVAQVGIELIGPDGPAADAEIVLVAAEALAAVGLDRLSFDLTLPTFAPALLDGAGLTRDRRAELAHGLDRKDVAAVRAHGGPLADVLTALLRAAGPADRVLAALDEAVLPPVAQDLARRMATTVEAILSRAPALRLTIDPVEFRGFRYHTGVCITVYAPGRRKELGRGGRYVCGEAEPATGLTLFPDAVAQSVPAGPVRPRLFLPWDCPTERAVASRSRGFVTVAALDPAVDPWAEARRLRCSHILLDGVPRSLAE